MIGIVDVEGGRVELEGEEEGGEPISISSAFICLETKDGFSTVIIRFFSFFELEFSYGEHSFSKKAGAGRSVSEADPLTVMKSFSSDELSDRVN